MTIHITPNDTNNPPGKLADAEIHFTGGPLAGLRLIGFSIWERRTGNGRNVTFPARQYSINGERRSFALLRPIVDATAQDTIRTAILRAYEAYEEAAAAPTTEPTGNDYPRVRASLTCPLCNGTKDAGLIACWTCYRSHGMRNGLTTSDAAIISHAEAASDNTPAAARAATTTAESLFT